MKKPFITNKIFVLVDEDGYEIECNLTEFKEGNIIYGYVQMCYGNHNECFLVKVDTDSIPPTMELIEENEFDTVSKIFIYHPNTPNYYPLEIDKEDFNRGFYK